MSALFENLYVLLQDELRRQESVLAACQAQGEAVRQRDLELLEAKTAALTNLMQQVAHAAVERVRLMDAIAVQCDLPRSGLTLDKLIDFAPPSVRGRLHEVRRQLRLVLRQTRPVVQANAGTLRGAIQATQNSLCILQPAPPGAGYDAAGLTAGSQARGASRLDQRG